MRRTKEQAEQTRAAILDAAEHLFLERGVANTSLEQIAKAAGVTRGAVYWHFENKAHLFHALLDQVTLPVAQMAERLSGCDGSDPLMSLRALCIEAVENLARDEQRKRIFKIIVQRCEFAGELAVIEQQLNLIVSQFISLVEELFQRPECNARLRPGVTPRLAARGVHAVLVGLFTDYSRDPDLFDPLQDTAPLIDTQLRGLLRDWQPDQATPAS
ncbi:TetR family transcriptional regulator [Pseudomonas sp. LRF_L74]|uniref:TetR family transcriptional regulator n=1 Tax=Pseudomonas sp. LRF_L74 TaxID=3369422 RepID=UPI003F5F6DDF